MFQIFLAMLAYRGGEIRQCRGPASTISQVKHGVECNRTETVGKPGPISTFFKIYLVKQIAIRVYNVLVNDSSWNH